MKEQICPVCGCEIEEGSGYMEDAVVYCCEPCATGSNQCECDCCYVMSEETGLGFWSRVPDESRSLLAGP